MKTLTRAILAILVFASVASAEARTDNWSFRFSPGIGIGIPSDKSFGKDQGLMLRLATDVHFFGGLVLRVPVAAYLDGGTGGQNVTVRGSIGPLFRARLTKNPKFPSEFYFYSGFGVINLSPARSGNTWTFADFSIGLQPALTSWLSIDLGFDVPLIFAFSKGRDGSVGSLTGPRAGVVLSL